MFVKFTVVGGEEMFEDFAVFDYYGYVEAEKFNHKIWSHNAAEASKCLELIQVCQKDYEGVCHPLNITDVRSVQMEHREKLESVFF